MSAETEKQLKILNKNLEDINANLKKINTNLYEFVFHMVNFKK